MVAQERVCGQHVRVGLLSLFYNSVRRYFLTSDFDLTPHFWPRVGLSFPGRQQPETTEPRPLVASLQQANVKYLLPMLTFVCYELLSWFRVSVLYYQCKLAVGCFVCFICFGVNCDICELIS